MNPTHPGESVLNCIEESGWTVNVCAERIGVPMSDLSQLLACQTGMSLQIAAGLESVGWSNAEFWMRLQANYDLAQERLQQANTSLISEDGRQLISNDVS